MSKPIGHGVGFQRYAFAANDHGTHDKDVSTNERWAALSLRCAVMEIIRSLFAELTLGNVDSSLARNYAQVNPEVICSKDRDSLRARLAVSELGATHVTYDG